MTVPEPVLCLQATHAAASSHESESKLQWHQWCDADEMTAAMKQYVTVMGRYVAAHITRGKPCCRTEKIYMLRCLLLAPACKVQTVMTGNIDSFVTLHKKELTAWSSFGQLDLDWSAAFQVSCLRYGRLPASAAAAEYASPALRHVSLAACRFTMALSLTSACLLGTGERAMMPTTDWCIASKCGMPKHLLHGKQV